MLRYCPNHPLGHIVFHCFSFKNNTRKRKQRERLIWRKVLLSYKMFSFYNFRHDWQIGLFNQIAFSDSVLFNEGVLFLDCIGNVQASENFWCAIYSSITLGISVISMSAVELVTITVICHRMIYSGIFSAKQDISPTLTPKKEVFKNKSNLKMFLFWLSLPG